jgi:protein gp37
MSKIEWIEQTWNPVTGCTKVSPGCKHCYAETMSRRLQAMGAPGYENGFKLSLLPERLSQPYRRQKPTMYFVNSMSDLFQDEVPIAFIDQVMDVIHQTPHHTYQILTKRSGNMREYFSSRPVPDNAWLGVSVEDRKYGKPRIPDLVAIKARTRFLSIEPLLEDIGQLPLKAFTGSLLVVNPGPAPA